MSALLRWLRIVVGLAALGAAFYAGWRYLPMVFVVPAPGVTQIVAGGAIVAAAFGLGVVLLFPQVFRVALTTYRGYKQTNEAVSLNQPIPPVAPATDFSLTMTPGSSFPAVPNPNDPPTPPEAA